MPAVNLETIAHKISTHVSEVNKTQDSHNYACLDNNQHNLHVHEHDYMYINNDVKYPSN